MGWVCTTCSTNNDDDAARCLVCDAERPAPLLSYDIGEQLSRASEKYAGVFSTRPASSHPTETRAASRVTAPPPELSVEEEFEKAMELISSNPRLHFEKIKACARRGYAPAQNRLGVCYQDGVGTTTDYGNAILCYKAAAEQGNMYAMYNIGVCYFHGVGVEQDYLMAFDFITKAAMEGHPGGYKIWGDYYYHGYMFKASVKESIYFYERGALLGDADCEYMLGVIYETGPIFTRKKSKAVEWYLKAANHGHEDARSALRRLT